MAPDDSGIQSRRIWETGLRGERGPSLLRYLLEHGADEFSIKVMALVDTPAPFADAFEDALGPYERTGALRQVPLGGRSRGGMRVRLWAFTPASLERLLSFLDDGLFHCPAGPDGWLEDLMIYRGGELILGVLSNEREGVLRLTEPEHGEVAVLLRRTPR